MGGGDRETESLKHDIACLVDLCLLTASQINNHPSVECVARITYDNSTVLIP